MGKNQNAIVVKDIEKILSHFLTQKDVVEFTTELEKRKVTETKKDLSFKAKDSYQLNANLSHGSKERELIQSILSFSENRISEIAHYKMMHELSQLMISNGELKLAAEICEDLIIKIGGNNCYSSLEADSYLALAKIAWSQAYWEESVRYVQKSYELYKISENLNGYAKCENMLGTIFGEQGDVLEAYNHFKKGLEYFSDINDDSLRAMFELNLGILLNIQGEYAKAMWNFKNALNKFIRLKDTSRIARVRHNLGMIYTKIKDYQAAIEEFDASISISTERGYLSNCAIGYIGKAYIYTKLNNTDLAEAFTDKALEIANKINDTLSIADVYKIKGMIQSNLENYELSAEMFENSLRLNEDFENKMNTAESSLELSDIYFKTERKEEAEVLKNSAIGYYNLIKAKNFIDELLDANSN